LLILLAYSCLRLSAISRIRNDIQLYTSSLLRTLDETNSNLVCSYFRHLDRNFRIAMGSTSPQHGSRAFAQYHVSQLYRICGKMLMCAIVYSLSPYQLNERLLFLLAGNLTFSGLLGLWDIYSGRWNQPQWALDGVSGIVRSCQSVALELIGDAYRKPVECVSSGMSRKSYLLLHLSLPYAESYTL
jgi:hypothetical protein